MRTNLSLCLGLCLVLTGCQRQTGVDSVQVNLPDRPFIQLDTKPNPDLPESIKLIPGQFTSTVYEPTIIDTTRFEKQIARTQPFQGDLLTTSMFRPGDPETPALKRGRPNGLQVNGGLTEENRIRRQVHFPGITQARWNPPDPTLACGPNHLVQMVNSEIAFFSKDGTLQFQNTLDSTGSPGFFETEGAGDFCVDPRCFYDHYSNRFVVLCLEVYFGIDESYLTIAISDDDDPNGIWYKYRTLGIYDIGGIDYWADYPSFGFDQNGYYISGNLFSFGFSYGGIGLRTIDKTPMLSGQPITVNDLISFNGSTVQMAQSFGSSNGVPIGVQIGSSELVLLGINNPLTNPTEIAENVPIPGYDFAGEARNAGGSISVVGSRAMNAHLRDDTLYTCHSIQDGNRVICRWYQVDLNGWPNGTPTLNQSGDIDLGNGQFSFFPSIYSNDNGNVAITFGNSSNSELISVKVAGRLADDPPGTMGTPVQFETSTVAANGRYGDYFDIALDPADGTTFWMTGEVMDNNGWNTVINSFVVETEAVLAPESLTVTRGTLASGSFAELAESDDEDISIRRNSTDVQSRTEMEIKGTSPIASPGAMEITLEGSVFARSNVVQTIELFNYDADDWEQVDSRNAATFTDLTVTVSVSGDASRFVQPGTGCVEARIRFQSDNPRQQFTSNTDHFFWVVQP